MDSSNSSTKAQKSSQHGQSGQRKSGGVEGEEESESEESSSSSSEVSDNEEESPMAALENFRREWEAELRHISGPSAVTTNDNSAVNLVTATQASLTNPYPNPTSMAGAVSKGDVSHPFSNAELSRLHPMTPNNPENDGQGAGASTVSGPGGVEEQARRWFLQGVGYERHGDLYDAVRCYRRAVQLVPDIEDRISQGMHVGDAAGSGNQSNGESSDEESSALESQDFEMTPLSSLLCKEDDEEDPVLIRRFLKAIEQNGWVFFEKEHRNDKSHLKDLPIELVSYILRWVVGSDLDVRSLDMLSLVSRGFYCIARDDKIWELACARVWGQTHGLGSYESFREMYLMKPRVRFDGCYISRITYIRPGENSFQDQSYRPWHFVEYFRYLRFFPDGTLYFLTTSEQPISAVSGLRERPPRNSTTMKGQYQLYGNNIVTAMVQLPPSQISGSSKVKNQECVLNTSFHLELEICSVKRRNNCMLKWIHHAAYTTTKLNQQSRNRRNINIGQTSSVTSTTFDITPTKYPPMMFSRVKSYTTKSDGVLQ